MTDKKLKPQLKEELKNLLDTRRRGGVLYLYFTKARWSKGNTYVDQHSLTEETKLWATLIVACHVFPHTVVNM